MPDIDRPPGSTAGGNGPRVPQGAVEACSRPHPIDASLTVAPGKIERPVLQLVEVSEDESQNCCLGSATVQTVSALVYSAAVSLSVAQRHHRDLSEVHAGLYRCRVGRQLSRHVEFP